MADNVDVTAGSGTTIHADEYTHTTLGSGKTQLVKLVDGTLDNDGAIAADIGAKANALRVAPANDITDGTYIGDIKFGEALAAGDNNIGNVDLASTNRTNGVEAITDWTAVAQNTVVESGTIDCSGHDATALNIQAFLDSTTAHTGTRFQIQVSYNTSGDEDWSDYREFVALIGTANTENISDNPLAAASTTITVADTGGNYETPPMGRWLAIEDSTLVNSELILNTGYTADTNITILDGTTNSHVQNTPMYDIAMSKTVVLDSTVNRARVVVNNTYDVDGSTLNYKVRATKLTR